MLIIYISYMMNKTEQNILMVDIMKIILSIKNNGKITFIDDRFNELYKKYMDIREEYDIWNEADNLTNRNGDIENTDSNIINSIQLLSANTDKEIRFVLNIKKRIEKDKFKELGILFFKLVKDKKDFEILFENEETRDKIQLLLDKLKADVLRHPGFDNAGVLRKYPDIKLLNNNNVEVLNSVSSGVIEEKTYKKNNVDIIQGNNKNKAGVVIRKHPELKINHHNKSKGSKKHSKSKYKILKTEEKNKSPLTEIIKNISNKYSNEKNNSSISLNIKDNEGVFVKLQEIDSFKPVVVKTPVISDSIEINNNSVNNISKNKIFEMENNSVEPVIIINNDTSSERMSESIKINNADIKKEMEVIITPEVDNNPVIIRSPRIKKITKSPDSIAINDVELNEQNKKNVGFLDIPKKDEDVNLIGGGKIAIKKATKKVLKNINEMYNTSSTMSEMDNIKLNKLEDYEKDLLKYPDKKCKEYKNLKCKIYNLKKEKNIKKYIRQYRRTGGKKQLMEEELNKM